MNFYLFEITPKIHISEHGYAILTGVVKHYEIIVFPKTKSKYYPLSDIVLHLN